MNTFEEPEDLMGERELDDSDLQERHEHQAPPKTLTDISEACQQLACTQAEIAGITDDPSHFACGYLGMWLALTLSEEKISKLYTDLGVALMELDKRKQEKEEGC